MRASKQYTISLGNATGLGTDSISHMLPARGMRRKVSCMPEVYWPGLLVTIAHAPFLFGFRRFPSLASAIGKPIRELKRAIAEGANNQVETQRQIVQPSAHTTAFHGRGETDGRKLDSMSKPTMSKERRQKEDGRYLISYSFHEVDEEDESEKEVVYHEPASLGSDAL